MARGAPGVKSQAISEYLADNKTASPPQIVAALKEKGIEVSLGLAKVVKYGKPGKKKAGSKRSKRTVTAKAGPAVSKSESIREFLRQNPGATPKVVQAGLKKEGIKVTPGLISNVAFYFRKKKKNAAPRVTVAARKVHAKPARAAAISIEQLIEVKRVADSMGGSDQVRAALDALAQLA